MRYAIAGLSMLLGSLSVATPAMAQVSVSVSIPGVSIGIHQPSYPDLVLVPGSPVYYAPHAQANYFFYDGLYWVFQDDNWYVSSWYNGPWDLVEPDDVPLFVLRVPVQYYVRPPVFFHTWIVTAPPRWHYHWGPRWTRYHHGWDHWDRHAIPAPAPLPVYQRHYHGDRYPHREYQRVIRHEHYRYQPRDQIVRRHEQQRAAPRPQGHAQAHNRPAQSRSDSRQDQRPQRDREDVQRSQRDREEAQRSQRSREELRQSESRQVMTQQKPQPQRQMQVPVPSTQNRPDVLRSQPQREQRERGESRKPEGMYVLPQQRAAVLQERQQQQQQQQQRQQQRQEAPQAQQAPRPQRVQAPQGRGDVSQPRAGAEQRQGPPDRGQERGRDRGQGRG